MPTDLKLVVVTPEKTTFDEMVESVVIPMSDGELGVLPGHSPLIGRLAPGELRVRWQGKDQNFYIEGGTVQISGSTMTVLTGRSLPSSSIDLEKAKTALDTAERLKAPTEEAMALKQRSLAQAHAMLRIAEKR